MFYGTQLQYVLRQHDITRLVLTGQVTEQCILYSALDAYVHHFEIDRPSLTPWPTSTQTSPRPRLR